MVDALRTWSQLFVLPLSLWGVGCGVGGRPMLLDQVCRGSSFAGTNVPNCRLSGDAAYVMGPTADSRAVELGPAGTGTLSILINAIGAGNSVSWTLDVLSASSRPEGSTLYRTMTWGSCGATCPSDFGDVEAALDHDFKWARVVDDAPGTGLGVFIPDDAVVTLRGADIDLIDIRTPGFDTPTGVVPR